jgi:hypothetical protein
MKWRLVTVVPESQPLNLAGLNPWKFKWISLHERITVEDPEYAGQMHTLSVYEIVDGTRHVRFASGEFSNGIYAFYEPSPSA